MGLYNCVECGCEKFEINVDRRGFVIDITCAYCEHQENSLTFKGEKTHRALMAQREAALRAQAEHQEATISAMREQLFKSTSLQPPVFSAFKQP